jgi:hypothetical protein
MKEVARFLAGLAGSASLGRRRQDLRDFAMERFGSLSQRALPTIQFPSFSAAPAVFAAVQFNPIACLL